MAHRASGLNEILVPRLNCMPIGRFLAKPSSKFPFNLCSRHRFFEPKHTTRTLCTYESSHLDFNCESAYSGGIEYYSIMCIKLTIFCYIMTVKNVVYVFCINLYTLSKLQSAFMKRPVYEKWALVEWGRPRELGGQLRCRFVHHESL
jgi:hypothetical protein